MTQPPLSPPGATSTLPLPPPSASGSGPPPAPAPTPAVKASTMHTRISINKTLPQLRDVSLYFHTAQTSLPKRVAMIRKTGMKIFEKPFRSILPFCGVFMCRNDTGNELLREMEPPKHNVWDPDHPERAQTGRWNLNICNLFVIASGNSLLVTIARRWRCPGLNRFLPDDDDSPEQSFEGQEDGSKEESIVRVELPERIPAKKVEPKVSTKTSVGFDSAQDDPEITEINEGPEDGGPRDHAEEPTSNDGNLDGDIPRGEDKPGNPKGRGDRSRTQVGH